MYILPIYIQIYHKHEHHMNHAGNQTKPVLWDPCTLGTRCKTAMRSRHGVFFIASTVVSTAQNTCFVAPLTGATNVEIRQRHREECEKLSEEHQQLGIFHIGSYR